MPRVSASARIAQVAGLAVCLVACGPVAPTPRPAAPATLAPATDSSTPSLGTEALALSGDGHFVSAPLLLSPDQPVVTLSHTGPAGFLVEAIQQRQRVIVVNVTGEYHGQRLLRLSGAVTF